MENLMLIITPIPRQFMKKLKLIVGKEYWVQNRNAVLENYSGDTAVCRDRWDCQFECDISYVQEKPKYKELPK